MEAFARGYKNAVERFVLLSVQLQVYDKIERCEIFMQVVQLKYKQ